MRHVQRSALVPYQAEAMYALVADVAAYPEFLPGCTGSEVLERGPGVEVARLALAKGPFASSFTTRNALEPPRRLAMELVDGPFSTLHGEWLVTPLSPAGCRIELKLEFSFAGTAQDLLMGPAFERLCGGLVDAFVARARNLYG